MALNPEISRYMDKMENFLNRGLSPAEFRLVKILWNGPKTAAEIRAIAKFAPIRDAERAGIIFYADDKWSLKPM